MDSQYRFANRAPNRKSGLLGKALRQLHAKHSGAKLRSRPYSASSNDSRFYEARNAHVASPRYDEIRKTASHSTLPLPPFFQDGPGESRNFLLPAASLNNQDSLLPTLETNLPLYTWQPSQTNLASTISLRASRSTLRLSAVQTEGPTMSASQQSLLPTPSIRRAKGLGDLRQFAKSPLIGQELVTRPSPIQTKNIKRDVASIFSITHFNTFCVFDTKVSGCPITAASGEMRGMLSVGDSFPVTIEPNSTHWIDMIDFGDDTTFLVLFSPMLSAESAKPRFILAAMIDVSDFIWNAANDPEERKVSVCSRNSQVWSESSFRLRADGMLRGCILPEDIDVVEERAASSPITDIWLDIADTEAQEDSKSVKLSWLDYRGVDPMTSLLKPSDSPSARKSCELDEILAEFMLDLQKVYADFFILSRTALDDQHYEISYVSPSVHASGVYVTGHITQSDTAVVREIGKGLSGESSFQTSIRWGERGEAKKLYLIPLYGERSKSWCCMLIDRDMPLLW